MDILPFTTPHFETMVAFIIRHNQTGENHIGYYGLDESEIRATLAEFSVPLEKSFMLAWEGETLVGVFGADYDLEIDRAWLFGPLVACPNWHETADQLYAALQNILPTGIHEQELFFDQRNQREREFAARHDFPPRTENTVLYLERAAYQPGSPAKLVCDYTADFFEHFERLHTAIFPGTYFTARQIVEKLDADHRLLLAVENSQVLGYHFCKCETDLGYIDFIGVDPAARGKGLGRELLEAGINWMFARPAIQRVDLTVGANNSAALQLYHKVGFRTRHTLCSFRRKMN